MVDRYDYPFIEDDDCWPQLLEKEEDGDFVLYQDYAALESENARLRAEVERLKEEALAQSDNDLDMEHSFAEKLMRIEGE